MNISILDVHIYIRLENTRALFFHFLIRYVDKAASFAKTNTEHTFFTRRAYQIRTVIVQSQAVHPTWNPYPFIPIASSTSQERMDKTLGVHSGVGLVQFFLLNVIGGANSLDKMRYSRFDGYILRSPRCCNPYCCHYTVTNSYPSLQTAILNTPSPIC